jgi:endoglycosylceramidase
MLRRVAEAFAGSPGVIGYDPLNEPWGDERRSIGPLYRDAAAVIRAVDPAAIVFLEGHVTTNCGLQTRLGPPGLGNVAYAPHFYHPGVIVRGAWRGRTLVIDRAFAHMGAKAEEWGAPLFVGEFGVPATAAGAREYVGYLYDRLDDALASGTQWNYAPGWNDRDKDGWNGEDFNILHRGGPVRPNFEPRPYPRKVAGTPLRFRFERADGPRPRPALELTWDNRPERGERKVAGTPLKFRFERADGPRPRPVLELTWDNRPERGATEVFLPDGLFPGRAALAAEGGPVEYRHDGPAQLLVFRSPKPGVVRVRLTAE